MTLCNSGGVEYPEKPCAVCVCLLISYHARHVVVLADAFHVETCCCSRSVLFARMSSVKGL